jgi:peptidoglycan/LPS O-acetylase OafA/YrhL
MGIIRILLALSVVINHSSSIFGFSLVGGKIAVQAFYIISGFYMALILNEKYIGNNKSYKLFMTNRWLRLYPVYWVVLILTILFSVGKMIVSDGLDLGRFECYDTYFHSMNFFSFLFLIITNLFLFLQDLVMFLGLNIHNGSLYFTADYSQTQPILAKFLMLPQAWTIGVELMFYLIAPLLCRRKTLVLVFVALLSLLLRYILIKSGLKNDPWSYRFFPTELLFFVLGIIAYRIYAAKLKFIYSNDKLNKVALVGVVFITCVFQFINFSYKEQFYFVSIFLSLPLIFSLTKKSKFDRYIGELSYPVYISHVFILSIVATLNLNESKYLGVIAIVLSVLLSVILNEVVSKRIEGFRQRRLKNDLN